MANPQQFPKAKPITRHVFLQRVHYPLGSEQEQYLLRNSMRKRKASNLDTTHSQLTIYGTKHARLYRHTKDKLINDANTLPTDDFKKLYMDEGMLEYRTKSQETVQAWSIDFKPSSQLTNDEIDTCFNLIESTSRKDYEMSSWGWNIKRKRREMKEDDMRYLLIRPNSKQGQLQNQIHAGVDGFLSFMLTHDSTPSVPVLYIYEIHLTKSLRSLGLGAHLMDIVENIAEIVGVEKIMLTCFVSNEKAHNFYKRRGYAMDPCSPEDRTTRGKTIKTDYVIMSKVVPQEPSALSKSKNSYSR